MDLSLLPAAVFALVPVVVTGEVSQISALRCKFFALDDVPETSSDGGDAERECDGLPTKTLTTAKAAASTSTSFDETDFGSYSSGAHAPLSVNYVREWCKVAEAFWGTASFTREVC